MKWTKEYKRKYDKQYSRNWRKKNPKRKKEYDKKWRKDNLDYHKKYRKQNREKLRKYDREWHQKRIKIDSQFRLNHNIKSAIWIALKGKKNRRSWETLVDYTLENLIKHLEKQFDDKMNWRNYGSYWHLDHIRPISSFKYTFSEDLEFKECWALENLQPLEKMENLKKKNKF